MAVSLAASLFKGPTDPHIQRAIAIIESFVLPTSAANAVLFPFAAFSGGSCYFSTTGTITWYAAEKLDGTVAAAYDGTLGTPVAVTQVIGAAGWYTIPTCLFGHSYIAPVVNAGTVNCISVLKK